MGLFGKLVSQTSIISDGTMFHEQFRYRTPQIPEMCPESVHRVYLERGQMGTVGSVLAWNFTAPGGKKMFSKEKLEAVDEEKRSLTFTSIEGDVKEAYNTFKYIIDVDQNNLVTWTLVYEKKTADVPNPHAMMDLCLNVTKEIERRHLLVPN